MRRSINIGNNFRLRDKPVSRAELITQKGDGCAEYTQQTMDAIRSLLDNEEPAMLTAAFAQLSAFYCLKSRLSPIHAVTALVNYYNGMGDELERAEEAADRGEAPEKSTAAESILRSQN